MRWQRIVAGPATILLGLMLIGEAYDSLAYTSPVKEATPNSPLTIEAIRSLAELTVLEIEVTDVVIAGVEGRTGGTTVDMLIRGTATIGVDLQQARFVEVDEERQHIVLTLPPPEVRRVAIDHQHSRVMSCQRSGLWRMAVGDALEDQAIRSALVIGQQRLTNAASRDDLNRRARKHAEAVVSCFVGDLGWTIAVYWNE